MPKKRRWPTREESYEKLDKGILDDTKALIPPYDLEEWEIRGEPAPEEEEEDASTPSERRESA